MEFMQARIFNIKKLNYIEKLMELFENLDRI